jgi:hypothetical protein
VTRKSSTRAAGSRLPILAVAFACLVVAVVYANRSQGTYQDDDVDRYYLSRQVWSDPALLLDRWGMPLPVAAFSAPARLFGYGGVEGTTAVVTAFAAAAIGLAARAAGIGFPWVAALLFFFQPLVLELSFSGLAEPFAAALVAATLWAWYARRRGRAVWLAGLLPLARIDAGALTVLVLIAAWRSVRWRDRVGAVVPVLLWNLAGFARTGEPLYVFVLGGKKPLLSLGPDQYLRHAIVAFGPVVLFFFMWALAAWLLRAHTEAPTSGDRARPSAPRGGFPALAGAMVLLHTALLCVLAWDALPFGRSVGFLRHVVAFAPALALVAAWGVGTWLDAARRARWALVAFAAAWTAIVAAFLSHVLTFHAIVAPGRVEWRWMVTAALAGCAVIFRWRPPSRFASHIAVAAGAAAVAVAFMTVKPIGLDPERSAIQVSIEQLRRIGLDDAVVYTNHPWFAFLTGRDRYDLARTPRLTRANLESAPVGSLVLWENHYGDRLWGDVPDTLLRNDPRFTRVMELEAGTERNFHVVAFRKTK